jgi:hypothetical protein
MALETAHEERDSLTRQVSQLRDVMDSVHEILGRVTGLEDSSCTESSFSKPAPQVEMKLEQQAEEIVRIVEQVQADYLSLEKELRGPTESLKSSSKKSILKKPTVR